MLLQRKYTTFGRLLLEGIHPGPPPHAGEEWFCADLCRLDDAELQREQRRLRLRLLLTAPVARGQWPSSWIEERLQRIDTELRGRGRGR